MCGIAGIWSNEGVDGSARDEAALRAMMDRMAHRGPDAEGVFLDAPSGSLGHRRLAIMDPAGGDQPIRSADGGQVIVANGEIYNHPKLRERLGAAHPYRTRSDTESILHLYEDMGPATAARLDGMFAFAIADGPHLYAARDALGIKPLYFGERAGALVFASELKALAGMAEDVREFPPGTWFHSKMGSRSFYEVPDLEPVDGPVEAHARRVRETLEHAVTKRLMSDVPVGAFLSGGLDSSIIAAIARRHVDELHTFSVGIEGSRDLEAARVVARHLGTIHHEHVMTRSEILERLPEIVHHLESFDQDLVRSAIPCYFASRLAAEHVKVILTGEGADELFAGYAYYKTIDDPAALRAELRRSIASLHNVNLQRVDRLTMAHSIEGRVPFLDLDMIAVAQTVPEALKLRRDADGRLIEKWILREACEDLLPEDIVWRVKEQFDEGSGTVDALSDGLDLFLSPDAAGRHRAAHPEARLRSDEEAVYHRMLLDAYEKPEVILANVARWAERG
ncbi:MAG: asparagine synthase B [Myxococcales bacterium]|nr:asparagine synthase B [Myxococcales bacterium]